MVVEKLWLWNVWKWDQFGRSIMRLKAPVQPQTSRVLRSQEWLHFRNRLPVMLAKCQGCRVVHSTMASASSASQIDQFQRACCNQTRLCTHDRGKDMKRHLNHLNILSHIWDHLGKIRWHWCQNIAGITLRATPEHCNLRSPYKLFTCESLWKHVKACESYIFDNCCNCVVTCCDCLDRGLSPGSVSAWDNLVWTEGSPLHWERFLDNHWESIEERYGKMRKVWYFQFLSYPL